MTNEKLNQCKKLQREIEIISGILASFDQDKQRNHWFETISMLNDYGHPVTISVGMLDVNIVDIISKSLMRTLKEKKQEFERL